ncbi:MAG TPA: hypothetical protein DEP00_01120 [Lachnospiraceae bacterium]|nr:hypothetical protein [Lachnospiraceae bacterium]
MNRDFSIINGIQIYSEANETPIPQEVIDFGYEMMDHHIYYKSENRKQYRIFCTACGFNGLVDKFEIPNIWKKDAHLTCPKCGKPVEHIRWGRPVAEYINVGYLTNYKPGQLMYRAEGIYQSFDEEMKRHPYHVTNAISLIGDKNDCCCAVYNGNDMLPRCYEGSLYQASVLYEGNLSEVIKEDFLKYAPFKELKEYLKKTGLKVSMDYVIRRWNNKSMPEKLYKVGLGELVFQDVLKRNYYFKLYDIDAKTVWDAVGISHHLYKLLLGAHQLSSDTLEYVKACRSIQPDISDEDIFALLPDKDLIRKNQGCFHYRILERTGLTLKKVMHYFEKEAARAGCKVSCDMAIEWNDMIEIREKLGYDTRNRGTSMPPNLHYSHQKTVAEQQRTEEARKKQQYQKLDKAMYGYLQAFEEAVQDCKRVQNLMHGKEYQIVPLFSCEALDREGHLLNHCVARYKDAVAEGKTMIFGIRKSEEIDKPFVTFEYKDKRITQCYGMNDRVPDGQIRAIADKFSQMMKNVKIKQAVDVTAVER